VRLVFLTSTFGFGVMIYHKQSIWVIVEKSTDITSIFFAVAFLGIAMLLLEGITFLIMKYNQRKAMYKLSRM
jgi:hypothetical protein